MAASPESSPHTAKVTEQNVETIAGMERTAIDRRTLSERMSEGTTRFIGSMTFVGLQLLGFAVWFGINLRLVPGIHPFDPFPFGILTLVVSSEAILLSIFVLMSQNRMSRQANQRAHLNLQINLLAEQETTRLLQEVRRIADRLGVEKAADEEIEHMSQHTHLATLAEKLEQSLPAE
jgi:uncharacterized membrane protein